MALDAFSGGTSAEQTTQTVSGQGHGVTGRRNQYTEGGAISVGERGSYVESGGVNATNSRNYAAQPLANSQISLGRGAALTLNYTTPAPLTNSTGTQPISSLSTTPETPPTPTTPTTPGTPAATTDTSPSWLSNFKEYWSGLSNTQKTLYYAGGATVVLLLGWLLFHRRK